MARLNESYAKLLPRAGQPQRRTRTWTYCVRGKHGPHKKVVAVLTARRKVGLVASIGIGHEANHIHPGSLAKRLRGHARSLGGGLWVKRVGSTRFFFVVRRGRVWAVGAASRSVARRRSTLRGYVHRARV